MLDAGPDGRFTPGAGPPPGPLGAAFSLPDLVLARAWARAQRLDLQVRLDAMIGDVMCEEMLVFTQRPRAAARLPPAALLVWRGARHVLAQAGGMPPQFHPTLWACLQAQPSLSAAARRP